MSDFSVGFYKIVYKDILGESNVEILNENGTYKNENYMGDTIHSFNSLANVILDNKSKNERSPKEEWSKKLIRYHSKYNYGVDGIPCQNRIVELKELLSEYVYERKQGDTDEITYAEYKNKYSYGNAGDYRQGARGCQRQRC